MVNNLLLCAFANLAQTFPQWHFDESKLISRYLRRRRSQTDSKFRAPSIGIVTMEAIANMILGYCGTYESSSARCFDQLSRSCLHDRSFASFLRRLFEPSTKTLIPRI